MEISSCENPQASSSTAGNTVEEVPAPRSRIMRFEPLFHWQGVDRESYKAPADHWCGITRSVLVGNRGEAAAFHLRYFEIAPGGFSSLESHVHEHAVVVMRGKGLVRLGQEEHPIHYGDVVYVAPNEIHQFRNDSPLEPLGFLCIVDARRDVGTVRSP